MRLSIVFLALLALAAAIPTTPTTFSTGDQEVFKKQQDVIYLLENIAGELPHEHLHEIGTHYEFEQHLDKYENPSVVKYYVGLVKTRHVQPKSTPFSLSISQLRKEAALLAQIFLEAKDYETFINTAAWARVHVNQDQFVKAFSGAVIARHDMRGVILPPAYEVFPHYFFDTRIIQKVYDFVQKYGYDQHEQHQDNVHYINVNYTSYLPFGENEIAYFTEDIGLNAYYSYVTLASYIMPYGQQHYGPGEEVHDNKNGHGAHYYYIHQQLLARYNLERLGQGLGPIEELDYYYEHIKTPFKPHLRYLNGENFPGRDEHIYVTPHHHNYELLKIVRTLERRIIDAIDLGSVVTPQGVLLSLYQPEGLNILGELIEATGHSINPRYYGNFVGVAKQLFGNVPEFNNIWEYTPSALELGQTCLRDPVFYQLYSKILQFFHYYQEALPSYQYNDVVVPGVHIENVEVGDLVTYFGDYEVDLSNAVAQPVGHQGEHQPLPKIKAHLKRLDHKQYEYTIHVNAEKPVQGAVVRVYVGPKYNFDGQPIDINEHRHYFYELDQFVYDLIEGHNAIVRNSRQATGQSYDWPSVEEIKKHVEGAARSQYPHHVSELFGFPDRLTLPKGTENGFPLQWFVIITSGVQHQPEFYGPVVEEEWMTYQPQHYQIVEGKDYLDSTKNLVDRVHGGYRTVEVIPDFDAQVITEGNWHWGYLYKRYPGSYYYPHWQQTHYHLKHHYPEHKTSEHSEHHVQGHHYPEHRLELEVPEHVTEHHYPEQHIPVHHYAEHRYPEHHHQKRHVPEYMTEHHYPKYQVPEHRYPEHHYPEHHYPEHQYPEHQYPEHHVPEQTTERHYPERHYPEHQYPEHHYPETHYPEHQYPERHVPEQTTERHYPERQYPEHGVPAYITEHHYPERHYPEHHLEKHIAGHGQQHVRDEEYKGKLPYVYQHVTEQPNGGKFYQTTYKQGMYHGQVQEGQHYGSAGRSQGTYEHTPTYQGYKTHDEYLHKYYEGKHVSNIIGGVVSLDGKPLGYPFDRQLAHSAFYAHNIYVKDVVVFHQDEYVPEY